MEILTAAVELSATILFTYDKFAEKAGDNPQTHRWRAQWHRGWNDRVEGIELCPYPVVRKTTCGAWIDPYAYVIATKQPWEDGVPQEEWVVHEDHLRWVSDTGAQAWAKPTRAEAINSLAVRLSRWADKTYAATRDIQAAAAVLSTLRPEYASYAAAAARRVTQ